MRELELDEVRDISGGIAPFVYGAGVGLATYGFSNLMQGSPLTLSGAVTATIGGGVSGGLYSVGGAAVTGLGAIARNMHAAAVGTVAGAAAGGAAKQWEDDS